MHNRVVIVTGASSGIGAATARALADSSRLVLVARREEALRALAAELAAGGCEVEPVVADLAEATAAQAVATAASERFGAIDALVNNAGVFTARLAAEVDAGFLDHLWALNVRAPMLLAAAVIPALRARGGGWIVNVSSLAATSAFPACGPYGATKAALEQWGRCLREEHRGDGIRVGTVAPGAVDTDAWGSASTPIPRSAMCRPADIARAIRFLLDQPATACIDHLTITPPG